MTKVTRRPFSFKAQRCGKYLQMFAFLVLNVNMACLNVCCYVAGRISPWAPSGMDILWLRCWWKKEMDGEKSPNRKTEREKILEEKKSNGVWIKEKKQRHLVSSSSRPVGTSFLQQKKNIPVNRFTWLCHTESHQAANIFSSLLSSSSRQSWSFLTLHGRLIWMY